MAEWVLWVSVAVCAYTYGGYLLVLVALDAGRALRSNARYLSVGDERRGAGLAQLPRVSVLIAAHDEAGCIRRKLENTLALDYPPDRLEVLVGSDGSTDGTDDIVREFADRGVVLSAAARQGKAGVLNRLAALATGDVFLFTDANTHVEPGALRQLVRPLADARVGGVCGQLRLVASGGATEEGAYWRFENLLKLYESRSGALMGANGGLYVLRREDWQPLPPDTIVDDFLATMRVVQRGRRLVYAPEAVAVEETAPSLEGEFRRRVRIAAGNFQSLKELRSMLVQPSFAAFALWSHKVLRWSVPLWLVVAFAANAVLAYRYFYGVLLAGQVALYLFAWLGRYDDMPEPLRRVARMARYFVEMNAALALGLVRFLRGRQGAVWQRTSRAPAG